MYIGGDITEITFNNEDVGSGVFRLKASEDNTYDLGGIRTADDADGITGTGEAIYKMNQKPWRVNAVAAWDMNTNLDKQKACDLAASTKETTFTISHINGAIYRAKGKVLGDIAANVNSGTFPLVLGGGGKLEKVA